MYCTVSKAGWEEAYESKFFKWTTQEFAFGAQAPFVFCVSWWILMDGGVRQLSDMLSSRTRWQWRYVIRQSVSACQEPPWVFFFFEGDSAELSDEHPFISRLERQTPGPPRQGRHQTRWRMGDTARYKCHLSCPLHLAASNQWGQAQFFDEWAAMTWLYISDLTRDATGHATCAALSNLPLPPSPLRCALASWLISIYSLGAIPWGTLS